MIKGKHEEEDTEAFNILHKKMEAGNVKIPQEESKYEQSSENQEEEKIETHNKNVEKSPKSKASGESKFKKSKKNDDLLKRLEEKKLRRRESFAK